MVFKLLLTRLQIRLVYFNLFCKNANICFFVIFPEHIGIF